MFFTRKIRPDDYLKKFINYCKEKYWGNLIAIMVYGSYAWGYFDKKDSDYDLILIFKQNAPVKKSIARQFKKISLQYSLTTNEVLTNAHLGHFTSYITILKGGRILYKTREFNRLIKKLRRTNPLDKIIDVAVIEAKSFYLRNELKKLNKFKAIKWALPSIRKTLQLLTFIRKNRLIWKLNKNLKLNKDVLTKEDILFIKVLNKKLLKRSDNFTKKDKQTSVSILDKINREILFHINKIFS